MKAGVELDKLIAEKVMGCIKSHSSFYSDHNEKNKYWCVCGSPGSKEINILEFFESEWVQYTFNPSTWINDAWSVVEDLKDKFDYTVLYHSNGSWIFTLQNILPPKDDGLADVQEYKSEAETPELAICLTALKSVGVEVTA